MLLAQYHHAVMYGQRFHMLRKNLWKGRGKTVLALAERLDSKYPATIYNIEREWRVPLLPTLAKHARALGCPPWDLLIDVETEYDLVRKLALEKREDADEKWLALLRRYKDERRDRAKGEVRVPTRLRRQVRGKKLA